MSLKVVNLSKRFKDRWVLRDVSFEVRPGEVFGITGASGAGKSTILRSIAGDLSTSGGEIVGVASNVTNYSSRPNDVSFWQKLFGSAPNPDSTQSLRWLISSIENSQGLLLLDDPFRYLDAESRHEAIRAIRRARDRGIAVVFASSNFEDILVACDRAAVLAGNQIVQTATPQDLYENPESRVVAAASGRCNLFEARRLSSSKADIPEFHTIDGGHRLFAKATQRGALGAINQNVTLGIRPEHVSIAFGASFPEDNLLRATITAVQFLGPTTLIDMDAGGLNLQALVLRLVGLNVGDECVLGLPIDKIHIFRD
ncbi:MAG TPA: ATP-binding cassette domain-containing protein [Pyrinomonadaceae bacterium]|nr:ATP-binding cassette domain-containing protein [Pyrinomonadaceae bacterium]